MIKVAFYIGKQGTLIDKVITFFTGKYSHVEFYNRGWCYSISWRDKGGRAKEINLADSSKWDVIELPNMNKIQLHQFYNMYRDFKYKPYDFLTLIINSFTKKDYDRSPDRTYCFKMIAEIINTCYGKNIPTTLMGKDLYNRIKQEFTIK